MDIPDVHHRGNLMFASSLGGEGAESPPPIDTLFEALSPPKNPTHVNNHIRVLCGKRVLPRL